MGRRLIRAVVLAELPQQRRELGHLTGLRPGQPLGDHRAGIVGGGGQQVRDQPVRPGGAADRLAVHRDARQPVRGSSELNRAAAHARDPRGQAFLADPLDVERRRRLRVMLRTALSFPLTGLSTLGSAPAVSRPIRQPATGPPGSYPDRTLTSKPDSHQQAGLSPASDDELTNEDPPWH